MDIKVALVLAGLLASTSAICASAVKPVSVNVDQPSLATQIKTILDTVE